MYKQIYTQKPLYLDLPFKFSQILFFFGVVIGRSISTPLTFNNSFNFKSVTIIFLFDNILLIMVEVVGLPLLICYKARYSGLFDCVRTRVKWAILIWLKYLVK